MPGRPPKPTALKVILGTDKQHPERVNHDEPKVAPGRPTRPAWLHRDARGPWNQTIKMAEEMGILTKMDGRAVALMCNALVEYVIAADEVDRLGLVLEDTRYDKEGNIIGTTYKANPALQTRADSWRRVNLMLQQFGMTPSSRAKLKVEKAEEEDEFEKLMRGRA